MFINFWYVADESKNITDKPVKKKMLGQNFVLFRDSKGKVHCLSDVCIHRGGSLAGGKLFKTVSSVLIMVGDSMEPVNVSKSLHSVKMQKSLPELKSTRTPQKKSMVWSSAS